MSFQYISSPVIETLMNNYLTNYQLPHKVLVMLVWFEGVIKRWQFIHAFGILILFSHISLPFSSSESSNQSSHLKVEEKSSHKVY